MGCQTPPTGAVLLGLVGLAAAGAGCAAEPSVRCTTSAEILCASRASCVAIWPTEAELSRFCRPDVLIAVVTCGSYSYVRYGTFESQDTYYYNAQTGRLRGAVGSGFGSSVCLGGPPWFSAPPASDSPLPPGCRQIPITCPSLGDGGFAVDGPGFFDGGGFDPDAGIRADVGTD